MKGLNIRVIVVTCIFTLGVALLGQHYIYQYKVRDPLLERIAQLTGVEEVFVETVGDRRYIALELSDAADLPDIHATASQHGAQVLGRRFGGVTIHDNRSNDLAESYYQMHFHIQQGIATGLFTQMVAGVDQIATQQQLESYRVYVDDEYVYLQLIKGEHSLYELIPRSDASLQAASILGGNA